MLEAERAVHADRPGVLRVADHRQHLARARGLAAGDQLGQQQPAEPLAWPARRQVDRIFQAEAVGRPGPEWLA